MIQKGDSRFKFQWRGEGRVREAQHWFQVSSCLAVCVCGSLVCCCSVCFVCVFFCAKVMSITLAYSAPSRKSDLKHFFSFSVCQVAKVIDHVE